MAPSRFGRALSIDLSLSLNRVVFVAKLFSRVMAWLKPLSLSPAVSKSAPPVIATVKRTALEMKEVVVADAADENVASLVGSGRSWLDQEIRDRRSSFVARVPARRDW